MVNYECNRCGYKTKHKRYFVTHLNRKKLCHPILEDTSIEYIRFVYGLDNKKFNKNHSKSLQITPILQNHSN